MPTSIICKSVNELDYVAEKLLQTHADARVFAFYGGMGVGKTTFIKAICQRLRVLDQANSPTFQLINEYKISQEESVCHFDFYRIKDLKEARDIGCEEYFYSGKYCFIEWPEIIESILPDSFVRISMIENNQERTISF